MSAHRLLMLVGLAALLLPQRARADDWPVRVTPAGARERTVEGGTVGSIVVRVANLTTRTADGALRVELPAGWRLVAADPALRLATGASELRVVAIGVPATALAGRYVVRFSALRNADRLSSASDSVIVQVPARRRLSLTLVKVPRSVSAGGSYTATFLLTNEGNVTTTAALRATGTRSSSLRIVNSRLTLAPRATSLVRVEAVAFTGGSHRIDVSAPDVDDSASVASIASVVEVLPAPRGAAPAWHTAPGTFAFGTATATGRPASMTAELRTAGSFVEGGNARFDLALKRPRADGARTNERSHYALGISSRRGSLRIGDQPLGRSPLLASSAPRFGGSGSLTLAGITAGGFLLHDRFGNVDRASGDRGGFADVRLGGRSRVGVDYLERTGPDSGAVATVHASIGALPRTTLEVDYGRGTRPELPSEAGRVRLASTFSRLRYELWHQQRIGWFGEARDRRASDDHASISLPLLGKLSLQGELRDEASRRESTRADDRAYRSLVGGASYGERVFAEYRVARRSGRFIAGPFDNEQESVRIGGRARFGRFSIAPRVEHGTLTDQLSAARRPFGRYRLEASIAGTSLARASAYAEWSRGGSLHAPDRGGGSSFGFDGTTTFLAATRLHLSWNALRFDSPQIPSSSTLDASLERRLPGDHLLTLRARLVSFVPAAFGRDQQVHLTYTVPFGLPTSRAARAGSVEGRVIDAESGRPLERVVVRLGGQAAVSGSDGRFRFSGLPSQLLPLQVDRESLAPGYTQLAGELVDVGARGDVGAVVEVRIARSSKLFGTLRVFDFVNTLATLDSAAVAPTRGLAGTLVTLRQGSDTLRVVTDSSGAFAVAGIRPGAWQVSLLGAVLPDQHYVERDSFTVTLAGGATDSVAFRVLPRRRTIQMITSGEQLILMPGALAATAMPARPTSARSAWPTPRRVVPPPAFRPGVRRVVPPPAGRPPGVRRIVPPAPSGVRRIVPPAPSGVRRVVPPPADSTP
jgi:hypothetical protein